MVNRFDAKTRASFHQHGEEGDLPVSAVLVFPNSRRSFDQILGDFAVDDTLQAVEAEQVIRTVFSIVMQAEKLLNSYFVLVAASTVAFMLLVLNLSLRLRRRELDLFRRMGCSRGTVMTLAGVDLVLIVAGSLVLSLGATAILTEGLSWYVNF
jgi:putative ABC transport system permease protein